MIEVSVVIVSWNTKDLLRKCLNSILDQTLGVSFEVWVIDNASSDGSPEMVAKDFPTIKLIRNKRNLGFAAANNEAIVVSSGRYVLLLNSDTEIIGNAIHDMVEFMVKHKSVGAVGCKLLNPDGSLQPSCHGFATILRGFTYATGIHHLIQYGHVTKLVARIVGGKFRSWTHFGDYNKVLFPDRIDGACMLLRRKALEEVGLLDERFFMYFEDEDLCNRLLQHGWKVAYTPDAKIVHYRGQSSKNAYRAAAIEYYKSNALLFKKYRGFSATISLRTAVVLGTIIRLLFLLPRLIFRSKGASASCSICMAIIKWTFYPDG